MSQAGIVDFEGSHPQVPTAFVTNVGTAIPITNVLEILGTTVAAHGIPLETTGSGNTVTIVAQYASAAATSLATNAGFSSFNSSQFTVDANGYVSLIGSGSLETLTGDDGVAVSPIGGTIQTLGNVVANSTHSKALFTTNSATNIERFDIQVSAAIASTNIAKVGLAAFNSTYFTVDANGFVSLNGGAVGETITGNTGGALSPVAGNWNILGTSTAPGAIPVQTSGSGNTLTVQVQKSQAIASTNASNVGLAAFNSTYFTVDANGFVSLVASSEVAAFTVDANTAPGTNPVVPNGSGIVTVTGGQVAAGTTTNVIRTISLAANSYTIQIQRSQAVGSSTVGDNGVSHFNSAFFTVDANGFVSLNGSAVGETITGNIGGALSPTAGNWNIVGTSTAAGTTPVQTSGSGSTLTVQVQKAQAIASTNATNVGLAAFNSTQFTVDANGFVSINGSGIGETITGTTGGALSPTAGNWNILGTSTAAGTTPVQTAGSGSTLTVQVQKAQAIASTSATNVGLAAFNSTYFTVDANGFVSLVASSEVAGFTVDAHTAPGTSPVLPNASGVVTITGGQVAAGTTSSVIQTNSLAANTYTIQIQRSQAVVSSTIGDNGVSHFNSAFFTVDSNGFVSLNGSAVGETITGNTGGALSPTAGNWNIVGTSTAAGTTPVQTAGSGSTLTVQVQKAQAIASTNATNVGLAAFNSAQFTVDANGFVALSGTGSGQTITGNTGGALSPTAGNWNIVGNNTALNGFATYTTGATSTLTVNSFGTNKWVVNPTSGVGTHTTIQAAVTAASAGDTVYVTANSSAYTENITLKAGVNIVGATADAFTPNVTIAGTLTLTGAGTVSISGINLQTNSAALLAVTGSAASIVNLINCNLNCTNNTGITFSSSSASAQVNLYFCTGNLGTTGIGLFSHSSSGTLFIVFSFFNNTGASTTASTASAGVLNIVKSNFVFPVTTSGTNASQMEYGSFDSSSQNATALTLGGSGAQYVRFTKAASGSASSISIGSTAVITTCEVNSSNTNAITGAGTITYSGIIFAGSSTTINTTTQTSCGTLQGSKNTAPSAGFLGERIASTFTVAPASGTPTSGTSISLTPGVWDITVMSSTFSSTNVLLSAVLGISTVNNTFAGAFGDQQMGYNTTVVGLNTFPLCVANFRAIVSATTTYYCVVEAVYSTGAISISGRLSAVRVG